MLETTERTYELVATAAPETLDTTIYVGDPRVCMSCRKNRATRVCYDGRGRRQLRCDLCFERKNIPGFGRKSRANR